VTERDTALVADLVEHAVLNVPGVLRMHGGTFGEVATYLPGRRIIGVRLGDAFADVHVVLAQDAALLETAAVVRHTVEPLVATPVNVYIEDLA
jgi:hypothetical protein